MERIKGGARERFLVDVLPLELISKEGNEGDIHKVDAVIVSKSGATRGRQMAEKAFRPLGSPPLTQNWKDPARQVEYMQELKDLNRRENLGLRLPATYRLRDSFDGRSAPMRWFLKFRRWMTGSSDGLSIIMTKLDTVNELDEGSRRDFQEDYDRQVAASKPYGFYIAHDAFQPCRDGKSGRIVAVLSDLGNCEKTG